MDIIISMLHIQSINYIQHNSATKQLVQSQEKTVKWFMHTASHPLPAYPLPWPSTARAMPLLELNRVVLVQCCSLNAYFYNASVDLELM